jgi:hypothetical protein
VGGGKIVVVAVAMSVGWAVRASVVGGVSSAASPVVGSIEPAEMNRDDIRDVDRKKMFLGRIGDDKLS